MKLFILASLFLAGDCTCADTTSARPLSSTPPTPIPDGKPCMSDGSMGTCKSKICIKLPDESQGACKASK